MIKGVHILCEGTEQLAVKSLSLWSCVAGGMAPGRIIPSVPSSIEVNVLLEHLAERALKVS